MNKDLEFMEKAISLARKSLEEGGIPVGSVLVKDNKIIGCGHNQRVQRNSQILHGEIDCLNNTGRIKPFQNITLYSTLMPCHMCAGAIIQFGIPRVVVGESKTFKGCRKMMEDYRVKVIDLDLDECKNIMKKFIKENPEIWNEDIGKYYE